MEDRAKQLTLVLLLVDALAAQPLLRWSSQAREPTAKPCAAAQPAPFIERIYVRTLPYRVCFGECSAEFREREIVEAINVCVIGSAWTLIVPPFT